MDGNPMFLNPFLQFATDVFRAVVNPCCARLAAPFDNPAQTLDGALCTQGKVGLDADDYAI